MEAGSGEVLGIEVFALAAAPPLPGTRLVPQPRDAMLKIPVTDQRVAVVHAVAKASAEQRLALKVAEPKDVVDRHAHDDERDAQLLLVDHVRLARAGLPVGMAMKEQVGGSDTQQVVVAQHDI